MLQQPITLNKEKEVLTSKEDQPAGRSCMHHADNRSSSVLQRKIIEGIGHNDIAQQKK